MTKQEFEQLIGRTVSNLDYDVIENVYTYHPTICNVGGKEQIADLYKAGGMPLINGMTEVANIMRDLEEEKREIAGKLKKIEERILNVTEGKIDEELCRKDAEELFKKACNPNEWNFAKKFLTSKYGESIAKEITEEVEG